MTDLKIVVYTDMEGTWISTGWFILARNIDNLKEKVFDNCSTDCELILTDDHWDMLLDKGIICFDEKGRLTDKAPNPGICSLTYYEQHIDFDLDNVRVKKHEWRVNCNDADCVDCNKNNLYVAIHAFELQIAKVVYVDTDGNKCRDKLFEYLVNVYPTIPDEDYQMMKTEFETLPNWYQHTLRCDEINGFGTPMIICCIKGRDY